RKRSVSRNLMRALSSGVPSRIAGPSTAKPASAGGLPAPALICPAAAKPRPHHVRASWAVNALDFDAPARAISLHATPHGLRIALRRLTAAAWYALVPLTMVTARWLRANRKTLSRSLPKETARRVAPAMAPARGGALNVKDAASSPLFSSSRTTTFQRPEGSL